jgi:hypothetical protein
VVVDDGGDVEPVVDVEGAVVAGGDQVVAVVEVVVTIGRAAGSIGATDAGAGTPVEEVLICVGAAVRPPAEDVDVIIVGAAVAVVEATSGAAAAAFASERAAVPTVATSRPGWVAEHAPVRIISPTSIGPRR